MIRDALTKRVILSLIIARDEEFGIGKNGSIPWHVTQDLKDFRHFTTGYPCIMGNEIRKSLNKPLLGRTNIVVSKSSFISNEDKIQIHRGIGRTGPQFNVKIIDMDGFVYVRSIYDACIMALESLHVPRSCPKGEIFIMGGKQIYQSFIDSEFPIRRYYISHIRGKHECDMHMNSLIQRDDGFHLSYYHEYDNHGLYIVEHSSLKGLQWKNPLPWMQTPLY